MSAARERAQRKARRNRARRHGNRLSLVEKGLLSLACLGMGASAIMVGTLLGLSAQAIGG